MEDTDNLDEATSFPVECGEDMSDEEFHRLLRQKVLESVSSD